ncbi:MAG: PHP domain-containing protein [Nitrospinota bacterium]
MSVSGDSTLSPAADLHLHSNASDGSDPPARVMDRAATAGLLCVSLTDHDTLDGLPEARRRAQELGLDFIPGIELSTLYGDRPIHLLGHFPQEGDGPLLAWQQGQRRRREGRAKAMIRRLGSLGLRLEYEELAGLCAGAAPGRGQLGSLLLRKGLVASREEAFDRYLGEGRPAYIPLEGLAPEEGVRLLLAAGAIPTLAHPALSRADSLLPSLCRAGLRGIEVDHPHHTPQARERYRRLARRHGLLALGGSDCHGDSPGPELLGSVRMPLACAEALKRMAGQAVSGRRGRR